MNVSNTTRETEPIWGFETEPPARGTSTLSTWPIYRSYIVWSVWYRFSSWINICKHDNYMRKCLQASVIFSTKVGFLPPKHFWHLSADQTYVNGVYRLAYMANALNSPIGWNNCQKTPELTPHVFLEYSIARKKHICFWKSVSLGLSLRPMTSWCYTKYGEHPTQVWSSWGDQFLKCSCIIYFMPLSMLVRMFKGRFGYLQYCTRYIFR